MADLKTTEHMISSTPEKRVSKGAKVLGRTATGAIALTMLLPLASVPAYAATAENDQQLTVEDIATVSAKQIQTANRPSDKSFTSSDLLTQVADKIEADRVARENARIEAAKAAEAEAQRVAAEKAEAERVAAEAAAKAEEERLALERSAAASAAAPVVSVDVPAGKGAEGIVAAALAQVGVAQDCTDLVQNSLAAVGIATRRDQGGFDLGTGIWQYDGFGSRVSLDALAPGDILIYGNAGSGAHVAIYIGNGQAVHGGYNGSTQVAGVSSQLPLTGAIRPA